MVAAKPVPVPGDADRPFWDGLREGRLLLSRCEACGYHTQRALVVCPNCGGESFAWSEVSGRGTIYAYTIARQTWVSGFEEDLPYVVVAVQIDEQPSVLITTNLVGEFDLDQLDIGLPVVATFDRREDVDLLQFRLNGSISVR